jgi:hypothetical protein
LTKLTWSGTEGGSEFLETGEELACFSLLVIFLATSLELVQLINQVLDLLLLLLGELSSGACGIGLDLNLSFESALEVLWELVNELLDLELVQGSRRWRTLCWGSLWAWWSRNGCQYGK